MIWKLQQFRRGINLAKSQWLYLPTRGTTTEYVDYHVCPGPKNPWARKAWRREQDRVIHRDMLETIERLKDADAKSAPWKPTLWTDET